MIVPAAPAQLREAFPAATVLPVVFPAAAQILPVAFPMATVRVPPAAFPEVREPAAVVKTLRPQPVAPQPVA